MGLLDAVIGGVAGNILGGGGSTTQNPLGGVLAGLAGGNPGAGGNLLAAAMSMLQQQGGLGAVIQQFQRAGLGQQADSWVGTGANMNLSADQLSSVFGGTIGQLAQQFGLSEGQASGALAQVLPELINQLTPSGAIGPDADDALTSGLSSLRQGPGGLAGL